MRVPLKSLKAATGSPRTEFRGREETIYLPPFFFAERGTAKRLTAIKDNSEGIKVDPEGLAERISIKTGMTYDEIQMQAILTAVQSKVLILTGGPGTGKTTTTLGIITAFKEAGASMLHDRSDSDV